MGGFQVNSAFWWQFNNKTIDCIVKKILYFVYFQSQFHQIQPTYCSGYPGAEPRPLPRPPAIGSGGHQQGGQQGGQGCHQTGGGAHFLLQFA